MSRKPRPTSIPSGILIHAALWPQQIWAENWRALCPFWSGELGPHLRQCVRGRGLPACQVSSWSIQPFGHSALTLQTFYFLGFRPLPDSAASHTAVLVWNSLPPALRENIPLATFKTKLKTYLFRRSQWLLKKTRRCCGGFAISAPWYKWLYLLTYLQTGQDR